MSKNRNPGLGRGLDSLIPNKYYNDDFDANSAQSLEDMLDDQSEDSTSNQENDTKEVTNSSEKENIDNQKDNAQKPKENENSSNNNTIKEEKPVQEDSVVQKHVEEVLEIVRKNPRITLWSVHSSAVFRYLRKTQPEFSISNEASSLIDEVVSQKYPEIWQLFEDDL